MKFSVGLQRSSLLRRLIAGLLVIPFSSVSTFANEEWRDEDWRKKALVDIQSYSLDAFQKLYWSQPISLWLFRNDPGHNLDAYANILCSPLKSAGKPETQLVIIRIYDSHAAAFQDELKLLGKANCK